MVLVVNLLVCMYMYYIRIYILLYIHTIYIRRMMFHIDFLSSIRFQHTQKAEAIKLHLWSNGR